MPTEKMVYECDNGDGGALQQILGFTGQGGAVRMYICPVCKHIYFQFQNGFVAGSYQQNFGPSITQIQ